MNKKLILALVIMVTLTSGLMVGYAAAAQAQPQKPITWIMSAYTGPGTPNYKVAEYFCNAVKAASGGRLIVKLFAGGAIVPATKEFDGVLDGSLDCASTAFTYMMDKFSVGSLLEAVVGGMDSIGLMCWYLDGGAAELAEKTVANYNVKLLFPPVMYTSEVWCHSKKVINSPQDIKGLRFRTAGDGGAILSKLGASVVSIPGGEVYEAMQRGVIDAFEYGTLAVDWSLGFQEVAPYVYLSRSRAATEGGIFVINKGKWEQLTPDLQAIVEQALRASELQFYAEQQKEDYKALQNFKEYGCEVLKLPASVERAVAEAAKEFYNEKAAKDPLFAEVLQSARDYQKMYEEIQKYDTPVVIIEE